MDFACDLHLHSCLSPCGEEEMTPANLVNMAALLGWDIIALTDHNSVGNCRSAMLAGEAAGVVVVPGMELCTAEEIHVVCLFPHIDAAEAFEREIYPTLPPVVNRPDIYGRQLLMDSEDAVLGEEPLLLVTASGISIDHVQPLVQAHGGVCYPAHIDRHSFSVLAAFGVYPPQLGFANAEVTVRADRAAMRKAHPGLEGVRLLSASDAHRLADMLDPWGERLPLGEPSAAALLEYLGTLPKR